MSLPAITPPDDYDRMVGSIFAYIEDGIPTQALYDLTILAENAPEFEAGMNAMVELGDIITDHYDNNKEPDDGPYDEIQNILRWHTKGDNFDPPEDWFEDGGPFGPDEDP